MERQNRKVKEADAAHQKNTADSEESIMHQRGKKVLRRLCAGLILICCLCLVLILLGWVLPQVAIGQIIELTGGKVKAKSVDIGLNGSVLIKGLAIGLHKGGGRDDAILEAKTVYARFGIGSLLLLRPRLKEICVEDFVLDAHYDLDTGRWNIAALMIKMPKVESGTMPFVRLENGTIHYSEVSDGSAKLIAGVPVEIEFWPAEKMQDGCGFSLTTAEKSPFGKSTLTGYWQPGSLTIAGAVSSANLAMFERAYSIDVLAAELNYEPDDSYSIKLSMKDLACTHRTTGGSLALERPAFLGKSNQFAALQRFFDRYRPAGRADVELEASGSLTRLTDSTLRGILYCKDISICDRKFPYPVENIAGRIDFTEKRAALKNLNGMHDDVKMTFRGWSEEFGEKWRYEIQIASDNMSLDEDLYNALNPERKRLWSLCTPSGLAAIDYHISRRSQTDKKKTLVVELLDAEATYLHFRYPLKNLTGRVSFDRDSITLSDVVSQADGSKIDLNGKVTALKADRPVYSFEIKAENVPLDSTLAASLAAEQRRLYERLNMAGLADAQIRVSTNKEVPAPADFTANISLKNASFRPNDFPLAVSDVFAKVVVTNDLLYVRELTGRSGQGTVSLTGHIWPGAETEELPYRLAINAEQAQLDDKLFELLPESLRKIVSELQPKGQINYSAAMEKTAGADQLAYNIGVECLGNSLNFDLLPFPLNNVTGNLTITAGGLRPQGIADIRGAGTASDDTALRISGRIAQTDGNTGQARFDLDLENITIFTTDAGEKYIDFDSTAVFQNCNVFASADITELDGVLKVSGAYETHKGFNNGQAILSADRLRFKGKSLTYLKADVFYDPNGHRWSSHNLIADCHGGRLAGKFELKQYTGTTPEYLVQIGFDAVDLKQFLAEQGPLCRGPQQDPEQLHATSDPERPEPPGSSRNKGNMSGSLGVTGQIGLGSKHNHEDVIARDGDHSRIGRCRLTITDMEVHKLSPLTKLLYVLKLTHPKDFAFDRMFVDSYVKGNRLFLEHLNIRGEALTLDGSGWMNLQNQNVDLLLFARGQRLAAVEPSILESLTEGLGQAVVRIKVTGNFCDPQVTVKTLPFIQDTLGILGTKPVSLGR